MSSTPPQPLPRRRRWLRPRNVIVGVVALLVIAFCAIGSTSVSEFLTALAVFGAILVLPTGLVLAIVKTVQQARQQKQAYALAPPRPPRRYQCPVCGDEQLTKPPRGGSYGSREICPRCGFQFGVSDDELGDTYDSWRERYLDALVRDKRDPAAAAAHRPEPAADREERLRALPEALRKKASLHEPFSLFLTPAGWLPALVPIVGLSVGVALKQGLHTFAIIGGIFLAVLLPLVAVFLDRRIDVDEDGLTFVALLPIRRRQRFPYEAIGPFHSAGSTDAPGVSIDKQEAKILDPAYAYRMAWVFRRGVLETKPIYSLSPIGFALGESELLAALDVYHPRSLVYVGASSVRQA